VKNPPSKNWQLGKNLVIAATSEATRWSENIPGLTPIELRGRISEARDAWLMRSPSVQTRDAYSRDLERFFNFIGVPDERLEVLASIRPSHIAEFRDHLLAMGLVNSSVVRKITVLRSLFSYLQTYGYTGKNPAHSDFVAAPSVPRDGKTIGLSPEDCRRLIDLPDTNFPVGVRDRAILAVLAYSACRVGELGFAYATIAIQAGTRYLKYSAKVERNGELLFMPKQLNGSKPGSQFQPIGTTRLRQSPAIRTVRYFAEHGPLAARGWTDSNWLSFPSEPFKLS
jgi:Phage integrase, N-terminal SAM-like domain